MGSKITAESKNKKFKTVKKKKDRKRAVGFMNPDGLTITLILFSWTP